MDRTRLLAVIAIIGASTLGCTKQPSSTSQKPAEPLAKSADAAEKKKPAAAKTYEGPFGLAGSMSIAELEELGFKEADGVSDVYVGKAPRPIEGINEYSAVAAPVAGVCRIQGTMLVDTVNGAGDQLKAEVQRLSKAMQVKYGKPSLKVDVQSEDVYKRNPEYWMLGLKEDSVAYGHLWSSGKTEQPLPEELKSIEISAGAAEIKSGYVSIRYTFKNTSDCQKEFEARKAQNL
jgi:hypothetical protein